MGHQDRGHYARKHPEKQRDKAIAALLEEKAEDGRLNCADAHRIAKKLGVTPDQIGVQADLAELRISRCQMGLFGYYPEKKDLNPDIEISPKVDEAIEKAQTDGRISCAECWELATALAISRKDMGSVCEKKGVRIKPCQLGAF